VREREEEMRKQQGGWRELLVWFYTTGGWGRRCKKTEPKSQDNFSPGQPWTRTALETIGYSTHVLKVKLFFQHLINNVKTHPNLCPVVERLYLKHENKDKNLITSFPINCGMFLSTDFHRVHVYCTQKQYGSGFRSGLGSGSGLKIRPAIWALIAPQGWTSAGIDLLDLEVIYLWLYTAPVYAY
jgi:hypothetical protein